MPTLRYTDSDDYAEANSRPIDGGFFADSTHRYTIAPDIIFFGARDETTGATGLLEDTGTPVISNSGLLLDFSDNTGGVNLTAAAADDILRGGTGDDTLSGGDGDDVLEGGAGADAFDGGDRFDVVSYEHAGEAISIDQLSQMNSGEADGDTYNSIESFVGSAYNDNFILDGRYTVEGGAGADYIYNIAALLGNPLSLMTVSYEHSTDGIYLDLSNNTNNSGGDAEGDTLTGIVRAIGSVHDDTLVAAETSSFLNGNGGMDILIGHDGNDTIAVKGAWAIVDGGEGFDRLVVVGARETIIPGSGSIESVERVVVKAGAHLDLSQQVESVGSVLIGATGGSVVGTQAADRITGGAGDDTISGAGGADTLRGGGGADTFTFASNADFESLQSDRILDFSGARGEGDRIDVSAFGITGLHEGAFSHPGHAELRVIEGANGFSTVNFDFDGDGFRDATLRVKSDAALTADDFVFAKAPEPQMLATSAVEHVDHSPFAGLVHPFDGMALV